MITAAAIRCRSLLTPKLGTALIVSYFRLYVVGTNIAFQTPSMAIKTIALSRFSYKAANCIPD